LSLPLPPLLELLLPPPPKPPKKKKPPPPPLRPLEQSSVGEGLGVGPDAVFEVPVLVELVELVVLALGSSFGSQSALLPPLEQAERRISRAVAPPIAASLCLGARAPLVVVVAMSASS